MLNIMSQHGINQKEDHEKVDTTICCPFVKSGTGEEKKWNK